MSKYRKVMVIPYFGKLPELLKLWMYTCSFNKDYDFFIYTDDTYPIEHPTNVFFFKSSLKEIKEKCSSIVGFKVELNSAYKLCDYRPAYGEIFYEDIKKYHFWGYCDLDILFGNISNFITDEILDKYSKVLTLGHFTLYKNNKLINSLYRLADNRRFYEKVFTSENNLFFDEGKFDALLPEYRMKGLFPVWLYDDRYNINCILYNNEIPTYVNFDIIADINILQDNLQLTWGSCVDYKDKYAERSVFEWNKGSLKRLCFNKGNIIEKEFMYIHLQKRKIYNRVIVPAEHFIILKNSIEKAPVEFTYLFFMKSNINNLTLNQRKRLVKTWFYHNGHRLKVLLKNNLFKKFE